MLQFRIKIIECVISSESPERVESRVFEVIQRRIQTGISLKRIRQDMPVLEADMSFQMRLDHSEKELANIKEALRLFRQVIQLDRI
jgi:hypothetical protein